MAKLSFSRRKGETKKSDHLKTFLSFSGYTLPMKKAGFSVKGKPASPFIALQ